MSESMAFRIVESQFLKEISEVGDRTDLLYQQMQKNVGRIQTEKTKKKTQVSRFNVDFIRSQRFKQFYEKQMGWVKVEKPIEGNEFNFENLVTILSKKKGVNEEINDKNKNNKNKKDNKVESKEEGKERKEVKVEEKEKDKKKESNKEMKKKEEKEEKSKKEMKKDKGKDVSKDGKETKKKEKKNKSKTK